MNKKKNIVILGAGPAGLSAGWKLSENGFNTTVIEKESVVGGQCATNEYNNFKFDFGGHRFITNNEELIAQIKELMGDELITVTRKSQIRLFNKFFSYPLEIKSLIRAINPFFSVICLADYLYSITKKKILNPDELSFEDWIVNRFGRSLYRIFFGMYTEKLWGISPRLISSEWAAQRITLINLWDVLLRLFGKKSKRPKTYALEFLYPRLGIGMIAERLAQKIKENGGNIILNADIQQIYHEEDLIKKIEYKNDGLLKEIRGDFYINTIPLPEFIQKFYPVVNKKYVDVSKEMKFRFVRFMNIIFDINKISDSTWIYVPEAKYVFFRVQETKNWSPYLVPYPNKTALILEIACSENDELWNMADEKLFNICISDLKKIGLIDDTIKTEAYFSTRLKHAYPIYDIDYKKKIDCCLELVKSIGNILSIGRQGLFRYNNMDHSLMMGMLTAEHIEHGNLEARIFSIASEKEAFEIEKKDKADRE